MNSMNGEKSPGVRKSPEEIANAVNSFLERLMPFIAPAGVITGFLFSGVFIRFRPVVPYLLAITTLSGALRLKAGELGKALRNPAPALFHFTSAHVIIPLLVYFLAGAVFRGDTDTITGFVLLYATPSAVTAIIWVSIFRGEPALALALLLLDTLTAPIVMPGTVYLLLGARVSMDVSGMIVSLLIMVVIPTLLGVASNEISGGRIPALISPYLVPLSKLLLFVIVSSNVSAVAPQVALDNPRIWLIIIGVFCFTILSFVISNLTSVIAKLDPEKKVSFLFVSSLRNSSATATIAIAFFPEAAAQPAILLMMFQQVLAALMGRLFLRKMLF